MKIIVDNLAIEYEDEGSGPLLLMLHGWGVTAREFDALCHEMREFRIVRLDLPGFGGSEELRDVWDVGRYSKFVASFCTKLGITPDILLGHSFGGRIIGRGLSAGVLRARKVVLIASAGVARRGTPRNLLYAAVAKVGRIILAPLPRRFYERFRSALYARSGSDYLTIRSLSQTFLAVIREDLSEDMRRIALPTLIVWGAEDHITPPDEAERLHSLVSTSKLVTFPNAGHFVHQEFPREVAAAIKQFV